MDLKKGTKNDKKNVSTTRGVKGGYFYFAPQGSKLPETYKEKLDAAFACGGFFSDEGWKESVDLSSEDIEDMNGDVVDTYSDSTKEQISMTLIEMATNPLILQYGSENVTEDEEQIVVKHNWSKADDEWSVVIDLLLKNGRKWRKVIPWCKVTDRGEVTGSKSNATGREITLTYYDDEEGNGCIDYYQRIDLEDEIEPAALNDDQEVPSNLESLTVDELKAHAEANGIDLAGKIRKDDIIEAIRSAEGEGSDE